MLGNKEVNKIMTAILVHMNGYSRDEAERLAPYNEGSELYSEIQEIIEELISDLT